MHPASCCHITSYQQNCECGVGAAIKFRAVPGYLEEMALELPDKSAVHFHIALSRVLASQVERFVNIGDQSADQDVGVDAIMFALGYLREANGSSLDRTLWFDVGFLAVEQPRFGSADLGGLEEMGNLISNYISRARQHTLLMVETKPEGQLFILLDSSPACFCRRKEGRFLQPRWQGLSLLQGNQCRGPVAALRLTLGAILGARYCCFGLRSGRSCAENRSLLGHSPRLSLERPAAAW